MVDEPGGDTAATFTRIGPDATAGYDVMLDGSGIGTVRPFELGAGQFGPRWQAQAPDGTRNVGFATRAAAAAWLIERTRLS
jgi:hypothetical protein